MKKSQAITNFEINIDEAKTLLNLSSPYSNSSEKNVLLKSSVVITIAYWERFIEELLLEGSTYISEGLRRPLDLPKIVKQKIALFSIDNNKISNPKAFSASIWEFAGSGWAERYKQYTQDLTEKLNTATPKNIRDSFHFVFGIKDIFENLKTRKDDPKKELTLFKDFITKRHEIAHGSDSALEGLNGEFVKASLTLEIELAHYIEEITWQVILPIVMGSSKEYSLISKYIFDIIKYFIGNTISKISINELKKISSTAYGNYNKLTYEPWNLLNIAARDEIRPNPRLFQFVENKITLPETICVLKNNIALNKPNCVMMTFSDLEALFIH